MIRVGVSGAAGRMGRLAVEAVTGEDELELGWAYAPGHDGEEIGDASCVGDRGALEAVDVVIELTRPDVVDDNLAAWRDLGAHAVVGTSGFDADRVAALRSWWGAGPPNCFVVPNFSIGAVLMQHFAAEAVQYFVSAEIVELHHASKVDAPSGTSIATSEAMGGGVPIHSVRLPGLVAHQEVLLGSPGELLTIRHDTTDRRSFMPGMLTAIRSVARLGGVTVGLDAAL